MRVYTVHVPPGSDAGAPPLLLAEGFSWGAALFGWVWLAAQKLWWQAGLALLAALLLGWASPWVSPWALLGLQVVLGAEARDIQRHALGRAGWREAGLVAAPDEPSALQRLVDAAA